MLDVLWLLLTTVRAVVRPRQDLVLENLLVRHQLSVLTGRLDADRMLGFASGTSCCGSWLAVGVPAGVAT